MKKHPIPTIIIVLFITLLFFGKGVIAQEISVEGKKVEYTLPYTGILPDNPLYNLKGIRDTIWIFLTRDYVKKARILLLISDKKIVMASKLSDNGKWNQAAETAESAEKDTLKIFSLLKKTKQQGATAPEEFIQKLKMSNEKHKEVIESILIDLPLGTHEKFKEILNINSQIRSKLNAL